MTVRQNVELPLKEKGVPRAERREKVEAALEAVGLADSADAHPWQLSGGMQQRVAIARAVAYEPSALLMDEPFAAVDAQTRADLEDLVRELWHRLGVTVLFVTHDIDESVYLGQRVIVLSNSPTVVLEEVPIDLPDERDQLTTRAEPRTRRERGSRYDPSTGTGGCSSAHSGSGRRTSRTGGATCRHHATGSGSAAGAGQSGGHDSAGANRRGRRARTSASTGELAARGMAGAGPGLSAGRRHQIHRE